MNIVHSESDDARELRLATRQKIAELEKHILCAPPADIRIRHYFAGGVYAREMFAPAGTVAVGKIIKVDNIATISQGDVSILTERGLVRVRAPHTWIAPAGTKRAAYFHADTVWTVYHATIHTDPDKVEKDVIAESFDDPALIEIELRALLEAGD